MKSLMLGMPVCLLMATADGCPNPPPQPDEIKMTTGKAETGSSARFKVHCEAVFDDDLAYGDRRAIYIITDTETGKQYMGVSGIGVSELGSHQEDKNSVDDER